MYEPKRFDFSIPVRVNLSSDTQTKPSRGMKEAMMAAEVGDEQMGSDPTVWALCDRTAAFISRAPSMCVDSPCLCAALVTACSASTLQHEPPPRLAVCSTSTSRCVGE